MSNSNRKRIFSPDPQEEEKETNPFTGSKDPYKILGVDRGCTKEDVKLAFRNYLLKVHPDKASRWDILNPDEATLASREVITAKRFFDDYFSKNPDPETITSSSPVAKKRRSCNMKPFEVTEDERISFMEECRSGVYEMERLIASQRTQIAKGLTGAVSETNNKLRKEVRNVGTILYKLLRSKISTENHEDLENID